VKVAVFSTKSYDRTFLESANTEGKHELVFLEPRLTSETSVLATGSQAVCAFVNDELNAQTLSKLASLGIKLVALRSAGFNNVDLAKADELGLTVVRVSAYSPYAVAEHTIGLILALNRRIPRAYNRVREGNFSLEGLLGFDLHGKTVGIVGTGRIGTITAQILQGFGCKVLAYDNSPPEKQSLEYVTFPQLLGAADIVSLHCPLTSDTHHLINTQTIAQMKTGAMLINTSRGALIDTKAVVIGLKSGKIGYLGLDVYEKEGDLFFEDFSSAVIQDDVFERLLTFPNVLITGHQSFFTTEAVKSIAETTLSNISDFEQGIPCSNQVKRQT
jgi:D-lactate dehydrogenase